MRLEDERKRIAEIEGNAKPGTMPESWRKEVLWLLSRLEAALVVVAAARQDGFGTGYTELDLEVKAYESGEPR